MDTKEFSDDNAGLGGSSTMPAEAVGNLKLEVKREDERPKTDTEANGGETVAALHGAQSECVNEDYPFNTSFKEAKEVYQYFWQAKDVFSRSFPSRFSVDGKAFCCVEQYVMFTKAILFHNDDLAENILKCDSPDEIKYLERKVTDFDGDLWSRKCLLVAKEGNRAKFLQNEDMKELLFSTYPKILVEASPYDKIWGIGLTKHQESAWNEVTWDGYNLLGYILTELRDELLCENGFIQPDEAKVYSDMLTKKLISDSPDFEVDRPRKYENTGMKHYNRYERHQSRHSDKPDDFSEERLPNVLMKDDWTGESDEKIKDMDEEFGALAMRNVSEKVQNDENDVEGHDKDPLESDERKINKT